MITQKELKEELSYNSGSGIFTRLKSVNNKVRAGDVSGSDNGDGYLVITIKRISYKAHRLA